MQTSEIRTQTTCLEVSIYLPPTSIYLGTVTKLHSTQVLPLLLGGTTTVEIPRSVSLSRAYALPYISPLLTCLPT